MQLSFTSTQASPKGRAATRVVALQRASIHNFLDRRTQKILNCYLYFPMTVVFGPRKCAPDHVELKLLLRRLMSRIDAD
jgi:hypothetical protein